MAFVADRFETAPEVDIRISGTESEAMRSVAAAIRRELAEFPGVYGIADSLTSGKAEMILKVTPAGEALGITLADLGTQVRQAFYGEEVQRIQRGQDDVRLMVRYTEQERRSLDSLYDLRIRTANGGEVPFTTVAEVRYGQGFPVIERTNGTRFAWVTAEVDPTVTSGTAVLACPRLRIPAKHRCPASRRFLLVQEHRGAVGTGRHAGAALSFRATGHLRTARHAAGLLHAAP